MEKFKKSQIFKVILVASLLIIAPLPSTSLRSYIFFIFNVLIVIVAAETGLFSFFLQTAENKKSAPATAASLVVVSQKPVIVSEIFPDQDRKDDHLANQIGIHGSSSHDYKPLKGGPSIFFVGNCEAKEDIDHEGEEVGNMSGQELFQKTEIFIGNFYKQLKIQREESWKKLNDMYQKTL